MICIDENLGVLAHTPDVRRDLGDDRVAHPGVVTVILNYQSGPHAGFGVNGPEVDDDDLAPSHSGIQDTVREIRRICLAL